MANDPEQKKNPAGHIPSAQEFVNTQVTKTIMELSGSGSKLFRSPLLRDLLESLQDLLKNGDLAKAMKLMEKYMDSHQNPLTAAGRKRLKSVESLYSFFMQSQQDPKGFKKSYGKYADAYRQMNSEPAEDEHPYQKWIDAEQKELDGKAEEEKTATKASQPDAKAEAKEPEAPEKDAKSASVGLKAPEKDAKEAEIPEPGTAEKDGKPESGKNAPEKEPDGKAAEQQEEEKKAAQPQDRIIGIRDMAEEVKRLMKLEHPDGKISAKELKELNLLVGHGMSMQLLRLMREKRNALGEKALADMPDMFGDLDAVDMTLQRQAAQKDFVDPSVRKPAKIAPTEPAVTQVRIADAKSEAEKESPEQAKAAKNPNQPEDKSKNAGKEAASAESLKKAVNKGKEDKAPDSAAELGDSEKAKAAAQENGRTQQLCQKLEERLGKDKLTPQMRDNIEKYYRQTEEARHSLAVLCANEPGTFDGRDNLMKMVGFAAFAQRARKGMLSRQELAMLDSPDFLSRKNRMDAQVQQGLLPKAPQKGAFFEKLMSETAVESMAERVSKTEEKTFRRLDELEKNAEKRKEFLKKAEKQTEWKNFSETGRTVQHRSRKMGDPLKTDSRISQPKRQDGSPAASPKSVQAPMLSAMKP